MVLRTSPGLACLVSSLTCLLSPTEIALLLLEKMQTQEILRILRLPELADLGQFFRSLSATTLVSMGALAAILAYWLTHRPKALQPPCNLLMQSEEVKVSKAGVLPSFKVVPEGRNQTCNLLDPMWPKESWCSLVSSPHSLQQPWARPPARRSTPQPSTSSPLPLPSTDPGQGLTSLTKQANQILRAVG